MVQDLNDDNFLIYAMKCFNSPNCIMSEFEGDLKRLKYIKRLIRKYKATGELKERLILNHIIVLSNVFTVEATVRMLFFKFDTADYSSLKPFLVFLSFMPTVILGIRGKDIKSSDILLDMNIVNKLRAI
jgi:hypothetical protein